MQAVGLDEASDARKIALLLIVAGSRSIEVFNTLEDKGKYDVEMEKFDSHFTPKKMRLLKGMFFVLVYNYWRDF